MPDQDTATGTFVKKATSAPMIHPALRPRKKPKVVSQKSRRTTVRVAKLINAMNPEKVSLIQVPIEPGFNNKGILTDPTQPLRHYLDKGFQWPHEFDAEKYPGIFCAVRDCWDFAEVSTDFESGTERCPEHEQMFKDGLIRYATSAREWKGE